MSNPLYKSLEIASLEKDIIERTTIIDQYMLNGYIDRDDVISKIKKLRITDKEVLTVTAAFMSVNATPFEQCTNEQLINELKMQLDVLKSKLPDKVQGGKDNANA